MMTLGNGGLPEAGERVSSLCNHAMDPQFMPAGAQPKAVQYPYKRASSLVNKASELFTNGTKGDKKDHSALSHV